MDTLVPILGTMLLLMFVICCVASGLLQVSAWFRHTKEGTQVSLKALKYPEEYFDEIGARQIHLGRLLLMIGAGAYISYGILVVLVSIFGAG